jgi:uncharacterized protein (TIGR02145 family)
MVIDYPLTQRINPMRKLLLTTAAVAGAIGVAAMAGTHWLSERGNMLIIESMLPVIYETFTDGRDLQTYRTVTIGGRTWMAQNLNYVADSSWCYENRADSCEKYGRLYTWDAAKKVCPIGYHLPSRKEWIDLVTTVGGKRIAGKKLKAKSGWIERGNGTDCYGFSALPGGKRYPGSFYGAGGFGQWWTATENGYYIVIRRTMHYNIDDVSEDIMDKRREYLSVRCVADTP